MEGQTDITTATEPTNGVAADAPRRRGGVPGNRGGQPGRSGPPGNRNRLSHGEFSFLTTGRLPPGCGYLRKALDRFEAVLTKAVLDKHGRVSLVHALAISAAKRNEGRAKLLARWLWKGETAEPAERVSQTKTVEGVRVAKSRKVGLSLQDRLALLAQISDATAARDRAIEKLRLDEAGDSDPWKRFYATLPAAVSAPATNGHAEGRGEPETGLPGAGGSEDGLGAANAREGSVDDDAGGQG